MRVSAVIWGLLCLIGAGALRGPSEVTVRHGEELSVTCSYDDGFKSYVKYWCRGAYWKTCEILIKSTDGGSENRYSMEDDPPSLNFTVTKRSMRPEDSDTYHCGIERTLNDNMHAVRVTVLPGVCRGTPLWASMVDFPPGFETAEEKEEVEVSCKEQYDNRTFHLTCVKEEDVFQFYPHPETSSCTRKCQRLIHLGQNISMHPVKEYYGQGEEVTLSCPAEYSPNYDKIRCVRANGTNIWNVTEVLCISSPRKCGKLMDSGQNISMYPVKEYYDQDEEVTLTCPTGYSPNYSEIRCVRADGTNTWNVTEVLCISSPNVNMEKSFHRAKSNLYYKVTEAQKIDEDAEDDPDLLYANTEVTEAQKIPEDAEDDPDLLYSNTEVTEDQKIPEDAEDDPDLIYEIMEVTPSCDVTTSPS